MFLERFYPDDYVDSTYQINFRKLKKEGIKGILFDIDNTLVRHGEPADERALKLFSELHGMGMKTLLISNNKRLRVKGFAEQMNSPYIEKAGKPSPRNYLRAMEQMQTNTKNTIFIGDQLFTDIYGAKKAGIRSILVKPIHPKEEIQIVLKRYLEKIVLYFYSRDQKKQKNGRKKR